jgi:hypothetical protein
MFSFLKKPSRGDVSGAAGAPIFIGGDGRSGTTLLSVVLDSHSDLVVGPELHFSGPKNLGPYVKKCAKLLACGDPSVFGKGLKENPDLKLGVQFAKRCHRFGIEFSELVKLIDEAVSETTGNLDGFDQRCVLINKIGELRRIRTQKARWGIKIMREIKTLHKYNKIWPGAQFIHIIRDGRDVAASQLIEHGTWGYADIEKAAKGWVNLIRTARKQASDHNYFEISYEDLVRDTEVTLVRLMEFLGLPLERAMLKHSVVDHTLFDNAYNHASISQVVKPINSSSVGRFREDLSVEQQEIFWDIAGSMLDELGYEK